MYLKEVVINGFKSFADRTRIDLRPGITAIVGPNGCGKSNIVDAIRWVLGEQSAKALRGGNMQDVIFSGTDKRKALPLCEVELVFSDCEAQLGTAFNEVSIARRVVRDGGSDYFLNGKPCRLKDVQRLFMDTGIGRESYSFMMQGQIDRILSANPAERRQLFEEAAGITRYKAQRKEALAKLTLVDQNLARVTDVIEEVSRQIGTLRRQASKALRYKRFKHRLTHLDLAWQTHQYAKNRADLIAHEADATRLRATVTTLRDALREREESLAAAKARRSALYARLQEDQQTAFNLRSEKENAEGQAAFADVRAQDLRERTTQVSSELDALEARIGELEASLAGEMATKASQAGEVENSDETYRQRQRDLDLATNATTDTEARLRQERQDFLMSEGEITRHRSAVTTIEVDLKSYQARHADHHNTLHQLREQRLGLDARLAETTQTTEARRAEVAAARSESETLAAEARRLSGEFREVQKQIQDAERAVARTSTQLNLLEQLHAKFEGFSEGAKAILRGDIADLAPAGSAQPLHHILDIPNPEDSALLETLLGTAAEAIVIDDASRLAPLVNALDQKNLGRAIFLSPSPATLPSPTPPDAPADPAALAIHLRPALATLTPRTPAAAARLSALLQDCYYADDLPGFLQYWAEHPSFHFLLVATPAGELVDRRGLIYGGRKAPKGKKETTLFQRENEIRALRAQLHEANDNLTNLNVAAMTLQQRMDEADTRIEEQRQRTATLAEELSALQAEERSTRNQLSSHDETISRQENQIAELEATRQHALQRMAVARAGLETKEAELTARRETIASLEQQITARRAETDTARDALNEIRLELATKRQQLQLVDAALASRRAALEDTRARRDTRFAELDTMDAQIQQHTATAQAARARAAQLAETMAATHASLESARLQHASLEQQIEETDTSLRAERDTLQAAENDLKKTELHLAQATSQCAHLTEKISVDYQLDITTLDWKRQLWLADEEFETKLNLDELDDGDDESAQSPGKTKENPASAAEAGTTAASGMPTPRPKHRGDPTDADLAAMDATDWPPLVREIADLRDRINSMGALNLAAIEEYADLRERHNFLKTQSDDLWNSKNQLTTAIDEINQTSQNLFNDTFGQIRKNFLFTFERLFNGGSSDLTLITAEDPLDSGIEIIARPPGTKLRSISLLSGGQRTMTAVALLFAIYMVKPSPFCVLDELDAPLDDANVGRFTDIVREFTRYSQFLVVTHNKRTVSAADTIYGVTMQERGVTKLLSMRFNKGTNTTEELTAPGANPRQPALVMAR